MLGYYKQSGETALARSFFAQSLTPNVYTAGICRLKKKEG
jgi:hypothetical protein